MAVTSETTAIEIINVRKTFDGEDYVLKGVDLNIIRGEITAVIGFSGTGKSVLLKHILGLLKPTEGEIKVLGNDIATLSQDEMIEFRQRFGVLFQNAALFDDMTVLENVLFPLNEHSGNLLMSERMETAMTRLRLVGIEDKHFDKLPNELSGGMRKRVGLARAIALDPDLLLYDEPTTGLDPIMTEMVDNLILETHRHRRGLTSVIVTHDLHAAFRLADHVAMLDSGRVLLYGRPKDFFESDNELVQKFVRKGVHKK